MKNLNKQSSWLMLVTYLLFTTNINAEYNQSYINGYYNGYENGHNEGYEEGRDSVYRNRAQVADEFTASDFLSLGCGMTIGITCMLTYNYLHAVYNDTTNIDADDQDTNESNRTTALRFEKRVEILNNTFSCQEKTNLNIPLIAAMTHGYSRAKLDRFLKITKRSAVKYNSNFAVVKDKDAPVYTTDLISMDHVNLTIDEMHGGSADFTRLDTKRILKTAIHEAGHAIAITHIDTYILYSVSIINRTDSIGRCISIASANYDRESWTLEDYKDTIIISLCGGLAEQVFGFDRSWYEGRYPVGAEQAFDECCKLAQNKNMSKGLADLLAIPGAVSDMVYARETALYMAKRYLELQSHEQDRENAPGQIQNYQCKILEECYQKALALIQSNKSVIEKIVQLLMKDDIIPGTTVYSLCGISRPLYAFEQQ